MTGHIIAGRVRVLEPGENWPLRTVQYTVRLTVLGEPPKNSEFMANLETAARNYGTSSDFCGGPDGDPPCKGNGTVYTAPFELMPESTPVGSEILVTLDPMFSGAGAETTGGLRITETVAPGLRTCAVVDYTTRQSKWVDCESGADRTGPAKPPQQLPSTGAGGAAGLPIATAIPGLLLLLGGVFTLRCRE